MKGLTASVFLFTVSLVLWSGLPAASSWRIRPTYERWEWREPWTAEVSPAVADFVSETLVALKTWTRRGQPDPLGEDDHLAWAQSLLQSPSLSVFDRLTVLFWVKPVPELDLRDAIDEIEASSRLTSKLTADWAMAIAHLCTVVASQKYREPDKWRYWRWQAHKWLERAAKLDPSWGLPIASLFGWGWRDVHRTAGSLQIQRNDEEWSAFIRLFPDCFWRERRSFMREHRAATDFRFLMPPPWLSRVPSPWEFGELATVAEWKLIGFQGTVIPTIELLRRKAILEEDGELLEKLVRFQGSLLGYPLYERSGVAYSNRQFILAMDELESRLWDRDLAARLANLRNQIGDRTWRWHPAAELQKEWYWLGRQRKYYLGRKLSDSGRRTSYRSARELFKQAADLAKDLRPGDLMPRRIDEARDRFIRQSLEMTLQLWPFTEEANQLLAPHTWQVARSDRLYALMSMVATELQRRNLRGTRGRSERMRAAEQIAFDETARLEERLCAAFWADGGEALEAVLDAIEFSGRGEDFATAEWQWAIGEAWSRAALGVEWRERYWWNRPFQKRLSDEEEKSLVAEYRRRGDEWRFKAAESDPNWVQGRLFALQYGFGEALAEVGVKPHMISIAAMMPADYAGYLKLPEGEAPKRWERLRLALEASDFSVMLPPPWLGRAETMRGWEPVWSSRMPIAQRPSALTWRSASLTRVAKFLAWDAIRRNDKDGLIDLLLLDKKLLEFESRVPYFSPYTYAGMKEAASWWRVGEDSQEMTELWEWLDRMSDRISRLWSAYRHQKLERPVSWEVTKRAIIARYDEVIERIRAEDFSAWGKPYWQKYYEESITREKATKARHDSAGAAAAKAAESDKS